MRRVIMIVAALSFVAFAIVPSLASAEVEQAVIGILGGMQCSL